MKKIIRFLVIGVILMTFPTWLNQLSAQDETASAEAYLRKYAMAEAFEIGIETTFTSPDSNNIVTMDKLYLTLAHTINENSTFKLRWGYLLADFKVQGLIIGELEHLPLMLTWINTISKTPRLKYFKPYVGFGVGYYYFDNFRPRKALKEQYHKYKDVHNTTNGYHFLGGIKYISQKQLCISMDISHEWVETFHLKDSRNIQPEIFKIDLSSWTWGLNFSLRF